MAIMAVCRGRVGLYCLRVRVVCVAVFVAVACSEFRNDLHFFFGFHFMLMYFQVWPVGRVV